MKKDPFESMLILFAIKCLHTCYIHTDAMVVQARSSRYNMFIMYIYIHIFKHQNVLYCCHIFARVSQTTEPGGWRDSGGGWSLCVVQLLLAEGEQREKTPGGKTPSKAFPGRENRLLCLNCSPPVR